MRSNRYGIYSYDADEQDLFPRKKVYSFWASVKYILILSLMLWWIPTFGQMIAGYVGGRKAGNHWMAALAAFFPVAIIWTLSLIAQATGSYPQLANLIALPAAAALAIGDAIPIFDATIRFLVAYVTSFAIALKETVSMGMNGYLVTIIFAYIGGLIADQTSRERKAERESEDVQRQALPSVVPSYQPLQLVPLRPRSPLTVGPTGWYRVHRERYDDMRRIPVSPYGYEEEPEDLYEPQPRPPQRRIDDRYAHREMYRDVYRERQPPEPPASGPRKLEKEELIRRLVERALREYDRSVR